MTRYFLGPTLLAVVGFLLGLQLGEAVLGLDRAGALVPAAFFGLVFGVTCLVFEVRRKPDPRDTQEVYVSDEKYQD